MTVDSATAAYAIDTDGRIAWVDEGFAALARHHGHPDLGDGSVVGRPLVDFVAGDRPRAALAALVARARRLGERLEVRYRCDAPDLRRHAVLRLEAEPAGGIVFTTWFEATEERPYQALLDAALPRDAGVVRLCAWCNRVDVNGWREADDAAARAAASAARPPRVEHTLCDICELLLASRPAAGPTRSGPFGPA